jgi:hypothetical protein
MRMSGKMIAFRKIAGVDGQQVGNNTNLVEQSVGPAVDGAELEALGIALVPRWK